MYKQELVISYSTWIFYSLIDFGNQTRTDFKLENQFQSILHRKTKHILYLFIF